MAVTELQRSELVHEGERIMVICNACRYCEGYCAVFPAMEQRRTFGAVDLHYLANLCHDCGECLYACQYAPPHVFAVNVPRTLAQLRLESYEHYAWPSALARTYRTHSVASSLALSAAMIVVMLLVTLAADINDRVTRPGEFYTVIPHVVMVGLFGAVSGFVLVALAAGVVRWRRDMASAGSAGLARPALRAVRDVLTLKYLHAHGENCTDPDEGVRSARRRWLHHGTFYGFLLCFASTSVAAVYHLWFGWEAPYAYTSLPVLLGTAGGLGLAVGPAGLYWIGRTRDPERVDPAQRPVDRGFIVLLFLSSITGLALLVPRETPAMALLLIAHLGVVLALFVTLPYGKFVHAIYRAAALANYHREPRSVPEDTVVS